MSLATAFNTINEQAGVLTEHEFDTKPENLHVLYYIARNALYSDEPMALIREYSCNSFDAHIASKQPDRPIQVTLPTMLESFLKIRDFGPGLDEEGIKHYVSFGDSSKRNDPDQTGMLGIGCKSGFTYGDSFIVNAYQNGKMTSWNAYIDPSNKGKMAQMVQIDTDEPDGIEVVIPIRPNDISKFHEKAMWFYSFSRVTPTFVNATQEDLDVFATLKAAEPVFKGENWKYMGRGTSYVVMGNIPYPIKADVFSESELRNEVRELLDGGIIINVPLGTVDFAASREALKYTQATKKGLSDTLNAIAQDLMGQCSASFTGCKSLWDAKLLYKRVFDFSSNLYRLRNLFKSSLMFNGRRLNNENFPATISSGKDTEIVCHAYNVDYSGKKLRRQVVQTIAVDEKHLVVINDTGVINGIMNRMVGLLVREPGTNTEPKYKNVYLMTFRDDVIRDQWLSETGIDCIMPSLGTLPKEPLSKYFPRMSGGSFKNVKHISKEFIYSPTSDSRYRGPRSGFWDTADVDVTADEGVYLVIEKFHYENKHNSLTHPYELREILRRLVAAGIEVPDSIYGLKADSATKAKANPKMVNFWEWMEKAVKAAIDGNPDLAQQLANSKYMNEIDQLYPSIAKTLNIIAKNWPYVQSLPDTHPLKDAYNKIADMSNYTSDKLNAVILVAQQTGYSIPNGQHQHDIKDDLKKLMARYPLFFRISSYHGESVLRMESWGKNLNDYIEMVDTVTP